MCIFENVQAQLDDGKYSGGVFVDFRKVFDTLFTVKYYLRN